MTPQDLKERREALHLSQPKLAALLGVDVMTVNRWEKGKQAPPSFLALALEALETRAARPFPRS
jgi:DNA-binding transcriptional regulator YiaG